MTIGAAQRSALAERGFVALPAVLSSAQVSDIRADMETHARARVAPGPYGLICHNPWTDIPALVRIMAAVLAPIARALLGADEAVLFQDIFIAKPPGTDAVQWHQDYSYWPLDRWHGLTMWLALDHADTINGCLRYLPGTHLLGERHPADFFVGAEQPRRADLLPLNPDECGSKMVDAPVRAGSVLVHHPLVWHMSPNNRSSRERHAWSITWLGSDVCWRPDHAPHPFDYQLHPRPGALVRGPLFPRFPDPSKQSV